MANFTIDIEVTNRCNAHCYFCPRDATPHQGLMSMEVFEQTLVRADEIRTLNQQLDESLETVISLCGLGEPLLHKHVPTFVRRSREEGFECSMSSNAALLDERRGTAVLEAGLQRIFINVGERDDSYEDIYKLPFEKTRDNIVRFFEQAGDQCEVTIVLVDHRRDKEHVDAMERYWRDFGITSFAKFDIMNRGGALFVDHMQYETRPELDQARAMIDERGGEAICGVPFISTFFGYDGNVYLCCSDWRKEAPIGSVFDDDAALSLAKRLDPVVSREPVCKTCNLDPLNALADEIRAKNEGAHDAADVDAMADELATYGPRLREALDVMGAVERPTGTGRRLIPVRSV
jgi:MoaA/NifB/PqqE/SkfB family radical SAM enzyme